MIDALRFAATRLWRFARATFLTCLALIATAAGIEAYTAPERFYRVHNFEAYDALEGGAVYLWVDREIVREHFARWTVTVRRMEPGGWLVVCPARSAAQTYKAGSAPLGIITLDFWMGGPCAMPPGIYMITTDREIVSFGGTIERRRAFETRPFRIWARPSPASPH